MDALHPGGPEATFSCCCTHPSQRALRRAPEWQEILIYHKDFWTTLPMRRAAAVRLPGPNLLLHAGTPRLAGDPDLPPGQRAAELLHAHPGGRHQGHHQAPVRGQHPQGRQVGRSRHQSWSCLGVRSLHSRTRAITEQWCQGKIPTATSRGLWPGAEKLLMACASQLQICMCAACPASCQPIFPGPRLAPLPLVVYVNLWL